MQVSLLIHDCIAGKRSAQNQLYQLFAGKMFAVCLRYTGNRAEAEDILQEGFIKVFTHLGQFRHQGSFEGWIRIIMVNIALRRYRNQPARCVTVSANTAGIEEVSHEPGADGRLYEKHLLQLVQQLPPVYRMVFNLYVFEGMKHKEIARSLGISEGTSKSNLHDARLLLQKNLKADESSHYFLKAG